MQSPGPPPALPARPGRGHCPACFPGGRPPPSPHRMLLLSSVPFYGRVGGRYKGQDLSQPLGRGEGKGGAETVYSEPYSLPLPQAAQTPHLRTRDQHLLKGSPRTLSLHPVPSPRSHLLHPNQLQAGESASSRALQSVHSPQPHWPCSGLQPLQ